MTDNWHTLIRLLFISLLASILLACGGDDSDISGTQAWVRIDEPEDGLITGSDTVTARGNAAMKHGGYPETIYWQSSFSSGVANQSVGCLVACIAAWYAEIPLPLFGENTITVTMSDGSDEVTVTRINLVVARGSITTGDVSSPSVSDIPVILNNTDTNNSITSITDGGGTYIFSHLRTGTYTITPSQPSPPQASDCLRFEPATRETNVPFDDSSDIYVQDFIATQVTPCYSIRGRVTASTNPTLSIADIKITLTDQSDNEMVRYTNASGYYNFSQLEPGTYTLTPSYCLYGCVPCIPDFKEVIIIDSNVSSQDFLRDFS